MKGRKGKFQEQLSVLTELTNTGVLQTRDVLGQVTYQYVDVCARQMDDAVRTKLIELGWVSPEEAVSLRKDSERLDFLERCPYFDLGGGELIGACRSSIDAAIAASREVGNG